MTLVSRVETAIWWRWLQAKLPQLRRLSDSWSRLVGVTVNYFHYWRFFIYLLIFYQSTSWLLASVLWFSQNTKLSSTETEGGIWDLDAINTNRLDYSCCCYFAALWKAVVSTAALKITHHGNGRARKGCLSALRYWKEEKEKAPEATSEVCTACRCNHFNSNNSTVACLFVP